MTIQRRNFLRGAAVAAGAAALGGLAESAGADASPGLRAVPFHGAHQAGILTDRQNHGAFLAFDVTAADRSQLKTLMQTLTERARFLTGGGTPQQLGISAPPSDSGLLGPTVPAGGLAITLSVGASLFDDRFGLANTKPAKLRPMDEFGDDNLDRAICDGDLLLQVIAPDRDTVLHAVRDIARNTRGGMQPRWRLDGFAGPPRPTGAPRNLLGFKDGIANPDITDPALMNRLVWAASGEPTWAQGGSYQVVRKIRMLVEFWDRVTITEQERMIGRRRDTGAPLSGSKETDIPEYADDPIGSTIPLNAHIRVANPRTSAANDSRILRRGYNYDAGLDSNGNLDMGLIFTCFQQDLDRQFVAVQKRLAGEPLVDYISPVGGGYFYALPGILNDRDWYARALLS